MNVSVPTNVKVNDIAEIIVNLPNDATGDVIIDIGGVKYTNITNNGVAKFYITNLTVGKHNVVATYNGDSKYESNMAYNAIEITKASIDSFNLAYLDNIKAGNKAVINITLPSDANGVTIVTVGNKNYTTIVKNDKGSIITDELATGKYTVTALYTGDSKYDTSFKTGNDITVSKIDNYDMDVEVIPDGDNVTVIVTLPDDATGNVTVTIDDKNYTVPVKNGTANITIPNLPEVNIMLL